MAEPTNELLPKPGAETSSFKVAVASALAPLVALFGILVTLGFTGDPDLRALLLDTLRFVVLPGIFAGGAVGWQYVKQRGAVSVAKLETYRAINAPPPAVPGARVEITQETQS